MTAKHRKRPGASDTIYYDKTLFSFTQALDVDNLGNQAMQALLDGYLMILDDSLPEEISDEMNKIQEYIPEHKPDLKKIPYKVVVVKKGKGGSYHREDCKLISGKKNRSEMNLEDAIEAGYKACNACI